MEGGHRPTPPPVYRGAAGRRAGARPTALGVHRADGQGRGPGCHIGRRRLRVRPRCPLVEDVCRRVEPRLLDIAPLHAIACHVRAREAGMSTTGVTDGPGMSATSVQLRDAQSTRRGRGRVAVPAPAGASRTHPCCRRDGHRACSTKRALGRSGASAGGAAGRIGGHRGRIPRMDCWASSASAVTPTSRSAGHVFSLYVDPAAQGLGVGGRLLEEASGRLRRTGA